MPLNPSNTRVFHRTLYAQMLQTIVLLKRGDDQQQGTVTALVLYDCRPKKVYKTGEPLLGDMSANHRLTWQIPRVELERVSVNYINAADRIQQTVRGEIRLWQPESTTDLTIQLYENYLNIDCLRCDSP